MGQESSGRLGINGRPIEAWEITEPVDVLIEVRDSSCILEITATNLFTKEKHLLNPLVLPLEQARALHDVLGQFLVRQQVYDKEFRNPSE